MKGKRVFGEPGSNCFWGWGVVGGVPGQFQLFRHDVQNFLDRPPPLCRHALSGMWPCKHALSGMFAFDMHLVIR
jgi:hypothetical protein